MLNTHNRALSFFTIFIMAFTFILTVAIIVALIISGIAILQHPESLGAFVGKIFKGFQSITD